MKNVIQVWWIPQVPMEAFVVEVPDIATGALLVDTLAKYDLFQFEHRVKPDYANVGGVRYKNEKTDGEWCEVDLDDEDSVLEALKDLHLT